MKKMLFTGLSALMVLAAGCAKDHTPGSDPGKGVADGESSVHVIIKGEAPSSRAIGTPTTDDEKTVHSFTVYVFNNATGVLEASETFTEGLEGTIDDLSVASKKKVVVFVNRPVGFPAVSNYGDFASASTMIGLETQVPDDFSATGLFMSGEAANPVTLNAESVVTVPVTVSRLTSKVRLGSLTVTPDSGLSLGDFALEGVSVQKARNKYDVLGIARTSGFDYVGGLQPAGAEAYRVDYLKELYALPGGYAAGTKLEPNVYFYVFPNDNTDGNATLLNLYGTYKGAVVHFPFQINDKAGVNGSTTDGTWIGRNKVYTLNVTLRKIGSGGEDPNIPNEQVSMDVEVEIADWESELIQDIEW
ncbi:fimbrial protein [uncultured Alistipes sp.]|jgi:lipoprotein|uniref:fimbrial protein n=1 Tax=uncultured Alistipes sp. TaxID=538949 RepID=UPI0025D267C2|nr:fimbrial protein [uncultured Alistipes sp.]